MLVAHDLLLMLLDDEKGKITGTPVPDKALAGAILIDLANRQMVALAGEGQQLKKGRLVVNPKTLPTEPALQHALAVLGAREGQKPASVLAPLAKGLRDLLAADLIEAGILREEEHKVLGLFRTTRLPSADDSYENGLRAELAEVLAGTRTPDSRTGPLIALLHAMGTVTRVITVADKRAAKRRAKEIADGDWAAAAVYQAVQAVQQAVVVAVMVSTTAATSGTN